ncbi:hypothetical protein D3C84_735140 [compost metagenome]
MPKRCTSKGMAYSELWISGRKRVLAPSSGSRMPAVARVMFSSPAVLTSLWSRLCLGRLSQAAWRAGGLPWPMLTDMPLAPSPSTLPGTIRRPQALNRVSRSEDLSPPGSPGMAMPLSASLQGSTKASSLPPRRTNWSMAYRVCCGRFFGCTSSNTETCSGIWSTSLFRLSIWNSWRISSITIQGGVG